MNYEEKYKLALSRAIFYNGEWPTKEQRKMLVDIFPELAESEDDRIREGIIRNLQYLMDRSEGFVKEDLQERIAWLEKQGEKNNTHKREIDDAYLQGICDAKHEIEKQGEQKTDPCTDCSNDKGCVTCEHGELRETTTRTLNADKVIAWLVANICDFEYYVEQFKKDFSL